MTDEQRVACIYFLKKVVEAMPLGGREVVVATQALLHWVDLELEMEYQRGVEDRLSGPHMIIDPDGQLKDE